MRRSRKAVTAPDDIDGCSAEDVLLTRLCKKLQSFPDAYAAVATQAANLGRPTVAVRLLLEERNGDALECGLVRTFKDCRLDCIEELLQQSILPACNSRRPDLLHSIVSAAARVGGSAEEGARSLARIFDAQYQPALQSRRGYVAAELRRFGGSGTAKAFYETLGGGLGSREVALLSAEQALRTYPQGYPDEPGGEGPVLETLPPGAGGCDGTALCLRAVQELALLRDRQLGLRERARVEAWPGGPHNPVGGTVAETIRWLVGLEFYGEADGFRHALNMEDRHYYHIKVKALIAMGQAGLPELRRTAEVMRSQHVSAAAFRPVLETFENLGCETEATECRDFIETSSSFTGSATSAVAGFFKRKAKVSRPLPVAAGTVVDPPVPAEEEQAK